MLLLNTKSHIQNIIASNTKIKTDKISHTSAIGSSINPERQKLIINCTGIAVKIDIDTARNFLDLNMLNKTKINQINKTEIIDILIPIGKIKALSLIKTLRTHKNGIIKTVIAIKDQTTPLFPNLITGKKTSQAKTMELIANHDQVNTPEIAISHMEHTTIPKNSNIENTAAHTVCMDLNLLSTVLSA